MGEELLNLKHVPASGTFNLIKFLANTYVTKYLRNTQRTF